MDWKKTVSAVAPVLGQALTVVNPMAGLAVQAVSNALLGKPDGAEDEIAKAVSNATPDQLLALKQADNQFVIDLERIGVDLEKIAQADRHSAREREKQVGGWSNPVLAGIIIVGFFWVVWHVLHDQAALSGPVAGIVGTLVGYVSAKADQVVSYHFGSSAGSKQKTDLLAGGKQ
jgi:hypothetical protein